MLNELVISVLVLLVSFAVRWFFAQINVQIDEATFNAIVGGIVTILLAWLGMNLTAAAAHKFLPSLFSRGFLR
jgi:uncharacterized membrane protein